MTLVGPDATVTLTGTLAAGGVAYRTLVQKNDSLDPLRGTRLATPYPLLDGSGTLDGSSALGDGYSYLVIAGLAVPLEDYRPINAGASVSLVLRQADLYRSAPGDGALTVVVLAQDAAGAWATGAAWDLVVDTAAPRFAVEAVRVETGEVELRIRSHDDDPAVASVAWAAGSASVPWANLRASRFQRAFLMRVDSGEHDLTVTLTDAAGNVGLRSVVAPPAVPAAVEQEPRWNLLWFLPDEGRRQDVMSSVAAGLPDVRPAGRQVYPTLAAGRFLDEHARVNALARGTGEEDASLRARTLAVPRRRHVARLSLQGHLSELAGGKVTLADAYSAEVEALIHLDGTRRLDGTWTLEDDAPVLEPGHYRVRLEEPPVAPLERVLAELARLRPFGYTPNVAHHRSRAVGIARRMLGVSDTRAILTGNVSPAINKRVDGSWTLDGGKHLASRMAAGAPTSYPT